VGHTVEGQHVVFTHTVELDVAHDNHLVVVYIEERTVDQLFQIDAVTAQYFVVHSGHPVRRAL